jgi:ABC-type lipopolysaccharide export system ATPase subunit
MSRGLILDAQDINAWYSSRHILYGVTLPIARSDVVGYLGV